MFVEVSEKEDRCTHTVLVCHVVCLEMIVLVYVYVQWFSEEKKNSTAYRKAASDDRAFHAGST